jgi:hypothetical protein
VAAREAAVKAHKAEMIDAIAQMLNPEACDRPVSGESVTFIELFTDEK